MTGLSRGYSVSIFGLDVGIETMLQRSASNLNVDFLRDHNPGSSVSGRGNCHNNAMTESSFHRPAIGRAAAV